MNHHLERTIPLDGVVNDLAVSPDGALLAIATQDKKVSTLVVRLDDGSRLPAPRSVRRSLAFDADGALVAAGARVERFVLTAPKPAKSTYAIPGHARGITGVALSPDGRWVAVSKYLEPLELWFVGGAAPERVHAFSGRSVERCFFRGDGAGFDFFTHGYVEGRSVHAMHRVAIDPRGGSGAPTQDPMPEGLSVHDAVRATPHGLAALPLDARDVVLYDWTSMRPRPLGVLAPEEHPSRGGLAVSPDGGHLVVQVYRDDGGRRAWRLVVVALPTGDVVATLPLDGAAGLVALAPGAARIARTHVDGERAVQVYARD